MPFGAHETVETHEILNEKMNMIRHFAMYRAMCSSEELRRMIDRQLTELTRSYDRLANYTRDYAARFGVPQQYAQPQGTPQQVLYGLRQPASVSPQLDGSMDDRGIALAVLCAHKNAAKNQMAACLEAADPNLRRMLSDDAVMCANMAYETFLFMNRQGDYQVPTLLDQTAKTFLHAYRPAGEPVSPFVS